jgi:hypothetical protein
MRNALSLILPDVETSYADCPPFYAVKRNTQGEDYFCAFCKNNYTLSYNINDISIVKDNYVAPTSIRYGDHRSDDCVPLKCSMCGGYLFNVLLRPYSLEFLSSVYMGNHGYREDLHSLGYLRCYGILLPKKPKFKPTGQYGHRRLAYSKVDFEMATEDLL